MPRDLPVRDAARLALVALVLFASACGTPAASPALPPAIVSIPAPPTSVPEPVPTPSAASAEPAPTVRDGYEPSVRLDNTTALNAARVPFAVYLNLIHNRIHPIFADQFLRLLSGLPKDHPLNQDLNTGLEIVLDQKTGQLVRVGIIKSSGVALFDQAALNTMRRAQPFGPAPEVIASPDGNVYLHWEFHRDPIDACTTRNTRPYILKSAP